MLKQRLASTPLLAYADYTLPFQVYTDGSLQGLWAALAQVQKSQEKVITYASQSLRPPEKTPTTTALLNLSNLPWFGPSQRNS